MASRVQTNSVKSASTVMAEPCHNSSVMSNLGNSYVFSGTPCGVSFFAFIRFASYCFYYFYYLFGLITKCSTAGRKYAATSLVRCAA